MSAAESKTKERVHRSNLKRRTFVTIGITGFLGLGSLAVVFICMFNSEAVAAMLNSWDPSLTWLKWVLGILFALIFVASTFSAIMLTYLNMRQRYAKTKFRVEVITVGLTLLLSIIVKAMVIVLKDGELIAAEPLSNVVAVTLQALYNAMGGLSLEGLSETGDLIALQLVPFYGTSIIAALVFIGVVGSTFAYEAYSYILIRVLYGIFPGDLHYDTFVFTALNDETLCLACSVAKDNPKAVIIFAGPALEPFDRHDELCAEVMGNGFLYWSYYEDANKSIVASLGLKRKRNKPKEGGNPNKDFKSFYVFAFDTNEKGVPEEEDNADAIFDDSSLRKEHPDNFFIHYVLLGRGENDFQVYQVKKFRSLDPNNADLSLWTEAKTIAEQVSSYLKCEDVLGACVPSPTGTRVRSIGFGETARAIVKALYIQSAAAQYEDNKIVEAPFFADVFDARSLEIAGFFKKEIPYAICYKKGETPPEDTLDLNCPQFRFNEKNYTHIDVVNAHEREVVEQTEEDFDYCVIATGDDRENINIANSIIANRYRKDSSKKLIIFVTVYSKRNNIFMTAPQEMVDALNPDPDNPLANEIRKRFEQEIDHTQKIINFSTREEAEVFRRNIYRYSDKLYAVIVGNREDTYLYPSIRYQQRSAKFNARYEKVSGRIGKIMSGNDVSNAAIWRESLVGLREFYSHGTMPTLEPGAPNAYTKLVQSLDAFYIDAEDAAQAKNLAANWSGLDLWARQSNIDIYRYSRTYYRWVMENYGELFKAADYDLSKIKPGEEQMKMLALLLYIEHARWNRTHIAAGWRFGPKDKPHRTHVCIVPMANLESGSEVPWAYAYDLSNVMLAIRTYAQIEKPEKEAEKAAESA